MSKKKPGKPWVITTHAAERLKERMGLKWTVEACRKYLVHHVDEAILVPEHDQPDKVLYVLPAAGERCPVLCVVEEEDRRTVTTLGWCYNGCASVTFWENKAPTKGELAALFFEARKNQVIAERQIVELANHKNQALSNLKVVRERLAAAILSEDRLKESVGVLSRSGHHVRSLLRALPKCQECYRAALQACVSWDGSGVWCDWHAPEWAVDLEYAGWVRVLSEGMEET